MFFSNVYEAGNEIRPIVRRFFVLVRYAVCSNAILVLCKNNGIKYDFPKVNIFVKVQIVILKLLRAIWSINKIHHCYVKMLHVRNVVINITT